jgi:TonB family protein
LEQSSTKLNYLSLVLASGAFVMCAATAGLSALPNSSNIAKQQQQLDTLTQENADLKAKLAGGIDNRHRIDELDVGLTAITQVANIDREKLSRAITAIKVADGKHVASTAPTAELEGIQGKAIVLAATLSKPAGAAAPTPKPASPPVSTPAPAAEPDDERQAEQAMASAPETPIDNPFAAPVGSSSAADTAAPLSIASEKAAPTTPLTIAQVDSILAKRISENWYKPANAKDSLNAVVLVKMSRDGKVASAKIVKASGNDAFDTSIISAVNSIMAIKEVAQLSEADYKKAYASRPIQFTPQMGG